MKALVHDLDFSLGSHGEKVSSYFLNDAPSGWSVVEFEDPATGFFPSPDNVSGAIDKAISKSCKIVIRSYSNVWDFKEEWDRAWDNGILVVHAHGSNSNVDLTTPPELRPSVMAVGGESPAGGYEDERSYGDGLELDAIAHDGSTAESWATPTVAAMIARLYDEGFSLGEARYILRAMALRNNSEAERSPERGYGLVASPNYVQADLDVGGDRGYGYTGAEQWAHRPTTAAFDDRFVADDAETAHVAQPFI